MIKPLPLRLLAAAVFSMGLLAACGGGDDDSFDDRADVADPKVRFVHAVPAGPNVTLQRNGTNEAQATNMAYKSASQYYDVSTQGYAFSLRTTTGNVELATTNVNASRGNKYTLVALPTLTGAELLTIRDPYNKSVASDDARLRVLNAAVNAQPFDVYVTAATADLAVATPQLAGIGFKQVQPGDGADSIEVERGVYRIRLTPAGSKTVIFNATVNVPENGDWLLVVLPESATPNSVRVLLVRSDDSDDATDEIVTE
jgi:Domain of unknown function (DUF4397)